VMLIHHTYVNIVSSSVETVETVVCDKGTKDEGYEDYGRKGRTACRTVAVPATEQAVTLD
jgi:hypothetical protein